MGFVESLLDQSWNDFHLILVDDGSTDGTKEMVSERIKKLTVITGSGSWWWAGCLQKGFEWLKKKNIPGDDTVLIINDDVHIEPDFLEKGISVLHGSKRSILLAQSQSTPGAPSFETGIHVNTKKFTFDIASAPEKINCLSTRGLFLRWKDFQEIGDFHPIILPHYWSDYEFTMRAHRKGYALITSPSVSLVPMLHDTGRQGLDYSGNYACFLKSVFSIKTIMHPLYTASFVLLTSPLKWLPLNLMRVACKTVLINLKYPLTKLRAMLLSMRIKKISKKASCGYRVIIGANTTRYPGWIATDYPELDITNPKQINNYFPKDSVEVFLAEHVFEHLNIKQLTMALNNCKAHLSKGGHIRIAVPDGFHPDEEYINQVRPGGWGVGSSDHKALYNYKTLTGILEKVGFQVQLLEWFDEKAKFHFVDWKRESGFVKRSSRYDERNRNRTLAYTSLIVDAVKP
ncbi:nucleotide-diphospho-sugar transferases [Desulfoluna butyratoxydans]|uniref:Nucleotide-diphospho-sugar transferases n=2 Tax=Desulfoluna butyratoxydans TaxID=231438 RepID=A0A4U8YUN5_9BACT|nr:nucleotide-diphospho-sugar transferases [Desulfoluna butyratoxydans]